MGRCVECGGHCETVSRCAWCAQWSADNEYCSHCGVTIVDAELVPSVIGLKKKSVSKMSLSIELDKLSARQHTAYRQKYRDQFLLVDRLVSIARDCQRHLLSRHYTDVVETSLFSQLPFSSSRLRKLAATPAYEQQRIEASLTAIASRANVQELKDIATIALLKLDDPEINARQAAELLDRVCDIAMREGPFADEALAALAHWRTAGAPYFVDSYSGAQGRKLFNTAYVKLYADDRKLMPWIAALCAKTEHYQQDESNEVVARTINEQLRQGLQSNEYDLKVSCAVLLREETVLAQLLEANSPRLRELALSVLARMHSEELVSVIQSGDSQALTIIFDLLFEDSEQDVPDVLISTLLDSLPRMDDRLIEQFLNYLGASTERQERYAEKLAAKALAHDRLETALAFFGSLGVRQQLQVQRMIAQSELSVEQIPVLQRIAADSVFGPELSAALIRLTRKLLQQGQRALDPWVEPLHAIYARQLDADPKTGFVLAQFMLESLISDNADRSNLVCRLLQGDMDLLLRASAGILSAAPGGVSVEFCEACFGTVDNFVQLAVHILRHRKGYDCADWLLGVLLEGDKALLTQLAGSGLSADLFSVLAVVCREQESLRPQINRYIADSALIEQLVLEDSNQELLEALAWFSSLARYPRHLVAELLTQFEFEQEVPFYDSAKKLLVNQCRRSGDYALMAYSHLLRTACRQDHVGIANKAASQLLTLQAEGITYRIAAGDMEFKLYDLLGVVTNLFRGIEDFCAQLSALFTGGNRLIMESWFIDLLIKDAEILARRLHGRAIPCAKLVHALGTAITADKYSSDNQLRALRCLLVCLPMLECCSHSRKEVANLLHLALEQGQVMPELLDRLRLFNAELSRQCAESAMVDGGRPQSRETPAVSMAFEVSLRWLMNLRAELKQRKLNELMPLLALFHNHALEFQSLFARKPTLLFEILDALIELLFVSTDECGDCLTQKLLASEIVLVLSADSTVASYCVSKLNAKAAAQPDAEEGLKYARRIIEDLSEIDAGQHDAGAEQLDSDAPAEVSSDGADWLAQPWQHGGDRNKDRLMREFDAQRIAVRFQGSAAEPFVLKGAECARKGDYIAAVKWFKQALKKQDMEDIYILISSVFVFNDLYDQAAKYAQQCIVKNPMNWEALWLYAQIQMQHGGNDELALDLARRAYRLQPESIDVLLVLIALSIRQEKISEAAKYIHTGIKLAPGEGKLYFYLGEILYYSSRYRDAIKNYRKAIEMGCEDDGIHCAVGNAFLALGDRMNAVAYFRKSIEYNEQCIDACRNLGELYLQEQDYPGAITYFEKAHALDPDCVEYVRRLAVAYREQGRFDKAILFFKRSLVPGEVDTEVLTELASLCQQAGRYPEAQDYLEQAIQNEPENYSLYFSLARAYLRTESYGSAVGILQRVIDIRHDCPDALQMMGEIYLRLDRPERAQQCFEQILQRDKQHAGALRGLGEVYRSCGDYHLASTYFKKALKADAADPQANYGCADTLLACERYEESVSYFRKAIEYKPDYADAYIRLGHVYFKTERFEEAARSYAKGASLDPTIDGLDEYLHSVIGHVTDAAVRRQLQQLLGR